MTKTTNRRWMRAARTGAKTCDFKMPWQRGTPRVDMCARRRGAALPPVSRRAQAAR
ncbi:hypothetical protein [Rhodobacter lacus]|uniref:Uncharacterized protein n=1 Tax=Rhodobacter lacus TaxID=1641972 RepID=A0ABW5A619_9RHOB